MLHNEQTEAINELVTRCGEAAISKGFRERDKIRNLGMVLMLGVTEFAEAMEEVRNLLGNDDLSIIQANDDPAYYRMTNGKPEGLIVELADVVVRTFDLVNELGCGCFGEIILQKLAYNESRPPKHGRQC